MISTTPCSHAAVRAGVIRPLGAMAQRFARPAPPVAPLAGALHLASLAALLAACGSGGSGGSGSGSGTAGPPPSKPLPAAGAGPVVPALPGGGERAFVANASGLIEVSTAGGSQVVAPAASWCNADARAGVVWFLAGDGLHAFDLADRRARPVVRGTYGQIQPIIDWGSQQLGAESKILFDVGAALRLARGNPEIEMVMGCDGDRAVYCFGDDGETPTADVARLQRQVGTLRLADPAYAASLARRGKQGSLWTPPPMPPTPPKRKPATDPEQCTELTSCGTLIAIPASPLWLVITGNSRGDYYHESRELWDPATGEYVRRDGSRIARTKAVPAESGRSTDYRGMRVSPTGVLSHDGAVFDATKVHYAPPGPADSDGASCGWAAGGWRIPGPSDG